MNLSLPYPDTTDIELLKKWLDHNLRLVEGAKVVLDRQFNNASVVTIKRLGRVYSTVTHGQTTWEVMSDRLSAIIDVHSYTLGDIIPQPNDPNWKGPNH